jgi:hypothetical protein
MFADKMPIVKKTAETSTVDKMKVNEMTTEKILLLK